MEKTAKAAMWLIIPVLGDCVSLAASGLALLCARCRDHRLHRRASAPRAVGCRTARTARRPAIVPWWLNSQELVAAAERLLHGELHLGGHIPIKFRFSFHPQNLTLGLPSLQQQVAGLVDVDLLIQAYELTGEEKFFRGARESIIEFARYERGAWVPRGLLWNDHAIANRVLVLSDFWRLYRHHDDFRRGTARMILELLARSGELLSRREHFTFASDHGVLQNMALLRLRLSFPVLPNAEYYQRLAMERLGEQMAFYVNGEGVILQHSAGYQFSGIQHLKLVFRQTRMLGLPVPGEWERKYTRALQVAAQLRRPDGSLPIFGDTPWRSRWMEPQKDVRDPPRGPAAKVVRRAVRPDAPIAWYPQAGYVVWWDGLERWPRLEDLRQTIVAFSFFPGHAHKHADELSVLLWAGGQAWWTSLGYWPYGSRERAQAESWSGSNAPHLIGESKDSQRTPRMLSYGSSERMVMLDVAREGPGAYFARRQVLYLRPNTWLVLDSISGAPKLRSMTRWTTDHGIILRKHEAENRYVLETQNGSSRLFTLFFGSPGLSLRTLPRSLGPFGARSSSSAQPTVPAIEVEQRAHGSWAAAVWVFDENGTLALPGKEQAKMILWRGPEHWTAMIPSETTSLEVSRTADRLVVRERNGRLVGSVVLRSEDVAPQRAEIRRAFLNATGKYPKFSDNFRRRQFGTYLLIMIAGIQELSFLAVARRAQNTYGRLRLLTVLFWIVGAVWLTKVFG